ncbi:FosX/FosE/FosI family fosfomycin resistance thiol transferase [Listeria monocytogenes]|uniref:FosX/FosE/FosI family fosfomycin resistance thiol transferase n=1 Tax=Listeria monocytogenes TaxID=1639 RepID=A0AB74N8J2_LISMN|nr:fosfomycin resistance hydrolase FosX [Listeria monocytogenes]EAC3423783.1 FosX/FosE/FosI family fosfomycin resistance thiol transferase [Listeria monocytogenes]EAC3423898.1 FosX/FosE/FosI family fosfomycin resistance thiol transferase [Listeria monocytogenes]EAC3450939.1 FosX/FosE/FosI family fosfomycin resistance thiol transferase [Listeria monocytogenes]EAC3451071.1 FosX/FosE/FosI family fosfomycin resistance thiol transferase [Listeria monocytogenes]EAC3821219.1 FosX/FosE/FosI family fos
MISGLSHITLIVKDLNRTTAFLQNIFDAEEIYSSGDKTFSLSKEKFFLIAGLWICIMEGDSLQERTYNHIAFQIQSEEVDEYIERIKALGVEMKPERPRVEGEGRSIYFYDFDNHLFELHAGTLEERLKRYHE